MFGRRKPGLRAGGRKAARPALGAPNAPGRGHRPVELGAQPPGPALGGVASGGAEGREWVSRTGGESREKGKEGKETERETKRVGEGDEERRGEIKPRKRKWGKRDVKAEGGGREQKGAGEKERKETKRRESRGERRVGLRERDICAPELDVPQAAQEASGKSKSSPSFVEGSGSKPRRVSEV